MVVTFRILDRARVDRVETMMIDRSQNLIRFIFRRRNKRSPENIRKKMPRNRETVHPLLLTPLRNDKVNDHGGSSRQCCLGPDVKVVNGLKCIEKSNYSNFTLMRNALIQYLSSHEGHLTVGMGVDTTWHDHLSSGIDHFGTLWRRDSLGHLSNFS